MSCHVVFACFVSGYVAVSACVVSACVGTLVVINVVILFVALCLLVLPCAWAQILVWRLYSTMPTRLRRRLHML